MFILDDTATIRKLTVMLFDDCVISHGILNGIFLIYIYFIEEKNNLILKSSFVIYIQIEMNW